MIRPYAFLFDIDGVLADCSKSIHHYNAGNIQEFHKEMAMFPIIHAGVVLYNFLVTQAQIIGHAITHGNIEGAEVPFVDLITARPERMRQTTMEWFESNGLLAPRNLHMRADDDFRDPSTIKLEIYHKHYFAKEEVLMLFEDNAETIRAFRDLGITCYQTLGEASGIIRLH